MGMANDANVTNKLEETWNFIEKGITRIQNIIEGISDQKPLSFEDWVVLYTAVDKLGANHEYALQLHQNYKQCFEYYITSTVLPAFTEKRDELLLKEVLKRWKNLKLLVKWLSNIFRRHNRFTEYYFGSGKALPTLNEVGRMCFRDIVYNEIKSDVTGAAISLIAQQRSGKEIDRSLLRNVVDFFLNVGIDYYQKDFELAMLEDATAYYSERVAFWISENSFPEYMLIADKCLEEEKERVSLYLHSSSEAKMVEMLQTVLLSHHVSTQLIDNQNSGFRVLLKDNKVEDMSRMYRLFCGIHGVMEPMSDIFQKHVADEVILHLKGLRADVRDNVKRNENQAQEFVKKAIEFHDKYSQYVEGCFMNNSLFREAFKKAFEELFDIEDGGSISAELLATFCDTILKKRRVVDDALEIVIKLIQYIGDKDIFAELYRKKLAGRLLFNKTSSRDIVKERKMLDKLKQRFGYPYTYKMDGMLADLSLAGEEKQNLHHKGHGIEITLTALTAAHWPSYRAFDLNIPKEVVTGMEIVKNLHKERKKNRNLTVIHSLGNCHVIGRFESSTVELIVTPVQGFALLLFNDSERLTYSEVKTQLNLAHDDEVVTLLYSLACGKYKILKKEPNTTTVTETDCFEVNTKISDKMGRIKVPILRVEPQVRNETKKVIEEIDKDRSHAIDAAIVRIMKSKRVCKAQELITECVHQLKSKFKPDVVAIRERFDDLIEREYMERDKDDGEKLVYMP